MNYAWYNLDGVKSVLAEFAYSDWDSKHIGRTSEPHTVTIEKGAMLKAAFASGNSLPWHVASEPLSDGSRSTPIATLPFYWNLINNTLTYRVYEQFVQDGLSRNVAHLHTGDDYLNYQPILPGDTITTTVELTVLYEKQGRAGPMKFIEDVWSFRNQHNVLAGQLVRKAVTIYYNKNRRPAQPDSGPALSSLVPGNRITTLKPQAWRDPNPVDIFDGQPHGYRQEIGPISWTMMVQWMGAVDDYARTHYDFDYAIERSFPGDTPIVAGPHMGALMIAPVLAWAGSGAWIDEFRHIQRHQINPKDKLSTFGVSKPLPDGRVEITAWLVDDKNLVRNTGTFVLRRWDNPPPGPESRRWLAKDR